MCTRKPTFRLDRIPAFPSREHLLIGEGSNPDAGESMFPQFVLERPFMDTILNTSVPFDIDLAAFAKGMEKEGYAVSEGRLDRLSAEARSVGRPKFLIRPAKVADVAETSVRLGDRVFTSRAMAFHFSGLKRVFPYIATAGTEMTDWVESLSEPDRIWGDRMAEAALGAALDAVEREVRDRFGVDSIARINPGSLVDWDLSEQRVLFDLLGDTEGRLGVRLAENLLMFPIKSGSGIVFPDNSGFLNCRLCSVSGCRRRRAAYEPGRYERVYGTFPPEPAAD